MNQKRVLNRKLPNETRSHTNNSGRRQVKRAQTRQQVRRMAKRLNIPYGSDKTDFAKLWLDINGKRK